MNLQRRRPASILFGVFLAAAFVAPLVWADSAVASQVLVLTVYLDGFVEVDHALELNQPTVLVNVSLLGETRQNLLVGDEKGLPLNYSLAGNSAVIYNLGSMKVSLSYLTQDLTSKAGKYWTLNVEYPDSLTLVLPKKVSIISLNNVPDKIENPNGCLTLTMPPGKSEVTYTIENTTALQADNADGAAGFEFWQIVTVSALSITVAASAVGVGVLRARKKGNPCPRVQEPQTANEVDVDKLLSRHRELRQDEIQVIRYLATKNGKAFESELFELLNLPRTTTWRLIRRLEGMEIVHVKKSRRQNIVLIREKYLKK